MVLENPRNEHYKPLPEKGPKRYLKPALNLLAAFLGIGVVISPFVFGSAIFEDPPEKEVLEAGEALVFEGRYEEALVKLSLGIAINPRMSDGYIFRAVANKALGNEEEAQADVMRAVSIIYDVRPGDIEREIDRILRQVQQGAGQTD